MSPEMYVEPQDASYPTDMWSLGVSMFELVTGDFPFQVQAKAVLRQTITLVGKV